MDSELHDYICGHIDPEPPLLRDLYRRTYLTTVYPHMCTDHMQGRILAMLTRMIRPRRILELGTFTGYSTLCFAEGMPPGCTIDTIEIDDEKAPDLRALFDSTPWGQRIHLHIGDALEVIPTLNGQWDLALIDANKRHYTEYYQMLLPRIAPGGYILADNTLWGGKLAHQATASGPTTTHQHTADPQTRGIAEFNDMVAADPRVETVILPIRDGLTLLHKKP